MNNYQDLPLKQAEDKNNSAKRTPKENPLLNIVFNVIAPALILSKLSDAGRLGPEKALILALSIPFFYWIYDYYKRRKNNFISIFGFVSILLSGGLGLLKLDGFWFAVKEAAIPGLIGIATLISTRTKYPLVKAVFYHDEVIDTKKIDTVLVARDEKKNFNLLMTQTTLILSVSFFLSAVLNFILARAILKSPGGTPEFNQELGRVTALSYPVIVVPSLIVTVIGIWWMIRNLKKLTGLSSEEIFAKK